MDCGEASGVFDPAISNRLPFITAQHDQSRRRVRIHHSPQFVSAAIDNQTSHGDFSTSSTVSLDSGRKIAGDDQDRALRVRGIPQGRQLLAGGSKDDRAGKAVFFGRTQVYLCSRAPVDEELIDGGGVGEAKAVGCGGGLGEQGKGDEKEDDG